MIFTELGKVTVGQGRGLFAVPVSSSPERKGTLNLVKSSVIHVGLIESAQTLEGCFGKQPSPNQGTRVDEIGIAREGGEALVRSIAVARWSERAELPVADTSGLEKLQNEFAAWSKAPTPNVLGREVGWRRTPTER